MESEYRRSMQKQELVLRENSITEGPGFYEKMLDYNRITGLLQFAAERTESGVQYRYDISSKQSLAERYKNEKMQHAQVDALIRQIMEIVDGGREYLIDENDYVIAPEYIYIADDTEKVYLCCYPMLQNRIETQLVSLFEYLLNHIDYRDLAAVGIAYDLYMKSKSAEFCFADMETVLKRYEETGEKQAEDREERETETSAGEENNQTEPPEEETVFTGYCLESERKEDLIRITQFPFFVGQGEEERMKETVYPIIGKTQAKFSIRGDVVYIEDMKSERGTFVNGRRIAGNEIHKLNVGDSVMLADRCYRFMRTG